VPLRDAAGFTIDRNTYRLQAQRLRAGQQDIDVEVGDIDDAGTFRPDLTIRRWGDRARLRIGMPRNADPETVDVVGRDRISWRQGDVEARFYDKPMLPDDSEGLGGFEYEVILHSRPSSNRINLPIRRSPNVRFWYQGTLQEDSDAQVAAGGPPLDLANHERPINVVSSYAVYTDRTHNRFRTGKLCHIYRPEAVDALGNRTWCRFGPDADSTNVLQIIVPPAFLASATYPITIDPTFGYNSPGASILTPDNGTNIFKYAACSGGAGTDDSTGALSGDQVITGLHAYCSVATDAGTNQARMAVYIDPGQTVSSSHTRAGSESSLVDVHATSATQYDFDATPTLSDGISYVVAVTGVNDNAFRLRVHYDSGGYKDVHRLTGTDTTFPADLSGFGTGQSLRLSMWGDYAAAGGGVSSTIHAVEADITYDPKTTVIHAVEADVTYDPKSTVIHAVEADVTYDPKTTVIHAVEADITFDPKSSVIHAVEADITYSTYGATIHAVEANLTYDPKTGVIHAVEADLTYDPKSSVIHAVEADITYVTQSVVIHAVEADITYDPKSATIHAVEGDITYDPKTTTIHAAEAQITFDPKTAVIHAVEGDITFIIQGVTIHAVEAVITYDAGAVVDDTRVMLPKRANMLVSGMKKGTFLRDRRLR